MLLSFHVNIASSLEKVPFVVGSIPRVRREFRPVHWKAAPNLKRIKARYNTFLHEERVSDEKAENVRTAFIQSARKSTPRASQELQMPQATVHKVLQEQLCARD
jgi:hypothetical protein